MLQFVLRRLVATIPVLVLVSLGVFLLVHMVPGDPVDAMLTDSSDPVAREALRRELGFDQPVYVQYVNWLNKVVHGDLGRSVRTHQSVLENVGQRIRPSLELALLAMLVALVIAVPLGTLTATHRDSLLDTAGTGFVLFGICMPNFVLALLLIFVFGVSLHWLPISSYTDPLQDPINGLRALTLPALTLGLALAAVIARTLRSSLLETLSEDFVRTARAKGLDEAAVVASHVMKNALIPVVTVLGLQFGTLIGGAVITEYVFALPGLGRLVVDSVFARDYPLVQGVVLVITVGFIVSNLLVDVVYGWLDPRIRYS
jgi:peptide/nickel transport system permease protein